MKLEDLVEGKEYKINKPVGLETYPTWTGLMDNLDQTVFTYKEDHTNHFLLDTEERVDCIYGEGECILALSWLTEVLPTEVVKEEEEDTIDTKGNGICTTCGAATNRAWNTSACDVCHGVLPKAPADESVKSDGGRSDYYKLKMCLSDDQVTKVEGQPLVDVTMVTGDVIRSLVDNDFDLGNIIKAIRRIHQAKKGQGKAGTTVEYDCKKIEYFLKEWYTAYQKEQI